MNGPTAQASRITEATLFFPDGTTETVASERIKAFTNGVLELTDPENPEGRIVFCGTFRVKVRPIGLALPTGQRVGA